MPSLRCMNDDISNCNLTICWKGSCLRVPKLYKPRRDGWWGKDRYMAREEIERPEGEMVCVRVRYENRTKGWQIH